MEEVNSAESTGYERVYVVTSNIDLCGDTAVREDITMTKLTKSKLAVVCVRTEIPDGVSTFKTVERICLLETMQSLSKASAMKSVIDHANVDEKKYRSASHRSASLPLEFPEPLV